METMIREIVADSNARLRENHSGMETFSKYSFIFLERTELRENHSGMET